MGLLVLLAAALAIIIAIGTLALIRGMSEPARITFAVALARRLPTEPRELGLTGDERTFRFDDGVSSPGWIITGHNPAGPTVIITHGLADSRYGALLRAPIVAPLASRIIIYDMRGHGDSTATKTTLTAKEPDDLIRVMNDVDNGSPFVLLGHSMGAGISIVAAAREGEAPAEPRQRRITAVIAEGGYRWPMETIVGYLRTKRVPPYPFVWLAGWHLAFWLQITNASFDRAAHAAKLKCPLLIINGDADTISPRDSAQQVADAAPNGKLVLIPGGDHGNLATTHRARYAEVVVAFIGDVFQSREA